MRQAFQADKVMECVLRLFLSNGLAQRPQAGGDRAVLGGAGRARADAGGVMTLQALEWQEAERDRYSGLHTRQSGFDELAAGLGWRPDSEIAMLWAYFDESGEHEPETGRLKQLTIGGWIASGEEWTRFSKEWRSVLERAGISAFHMRDFAHSKGDFRDWTEEKRRAVLNQLLETIARNVMVGLGFTSRVVDAEPSMQFPNAYESALVSCLLHVAGLSARSERKVSVVFARHEEFRGARIQRFFDIVNFGGAQLATFAVSDPRNVEPLQAADIVAYELQRFNRDGTERYPLCRLQELGCRIDITSGDVVRRTLNRAP
jgi:hypothetical protein